ncbi:MAG: hypothetical protein OXB86_04430, partial [Bdellovibrionales bacterium]|nr:hypothetical protein [Bdellovibrionales bacterium]
CLKKTKDEEDSYEPYFTRSGACIKIYDELKHKNYNRQIYTERKIHYISEDGQFYGQAHVGLNPWQGQFQFGKDLTTASGIRTKRDGVPFPSLVINQFRAVNFFPSYLIDKFLNIHISHNYYFLFQVIIARHDNIEHGSHPMGREFIRDGYYLARILIMRNPLETNGVETVEYLDEQKEKILVNEHLEPSFVHGGEYLSHVDTVINVRGNWVNIYVPTQFNNQQFIYLASRNQIAIQVLPADPKKFVYKKEIVTGGEDCELDLKKTKWEPYFNCETLGKDSLTSDCHELEIMPHTAPMQTNDWMNWNVLRRAPLLNTDNIIDQSELGKKRRFFTFHPDPKKKSINPLDLKALQKRKKIAVHKGKENNCSIESLHFDKYEVDPKNEKALKRVVKEMGEKCFGNRKHILAQGKQKDFDNSLEEMRGKNNQNSERKQVEIKEEKDILPSILKQFAEENALKVVDLSDPEQTQKLVSDLNETGTFFEEQAKAINALASQINSSSDKKTARPSRVRGSEQRSKIEEVKDDFSRFIEWSQDIISPETLEQLMQKVQTQCLKSDSVIEEKSFWEKSLTETALDAWSGIEDFFENLALKISGVDPQLVENLNKCSLDIIRSELKKIFEGNKTEIQDRDNTTAMDAVRKTVEMNSVVQIYNPSSKVFEEFSKKMALLIIEKIEKDKLKSIVNKGVTTKNYKDHTIGSFIHNLCFFWFDKYFSEYLTGKQMI